MSPSQPIPLLLRPKPTLPRELLLADPDILQRYAVLTADFNPLHPKRAFAAGMPFDAPIIHGTLGLNLVVEAIEKTFGALPADVSIDVRFSRPVPVGPTVSAVVSLSDPATGTYEIFLEMQDGVRALEGTCVIALD